MKYPCARFFTSSVARTDLNRPSALRSPTSSLCKTNKGQCWTRTVQTTLSHHSRPLPSPQNQHWPFSCPASQRTPWNTSGKCLPFSSGPPLPSGNGAPDNCADRYDHTLPQPTIFPTRVWPGRSQTLLNLLNLPIKYFNNTQQTHALGRLTPPIKTVSRLEL